MHELMLWTLATLAGVVLGLIFFGGLWWTVRKGIDSRQPALWFLGSLLLRMGIVLGGLLWVGDGDWRRLLLCVLGLTIGRILVTHLPPLGSHADPHAEVPHAP